MKVWTNCDPQQPHLAFFGRWCPLHRGHTAIIEKKMEESPCLPILILVRDTKFDEFSAKFRFKLVKTWMLENGLRGTIMIVPDINGVFWGRSVGYNVEEIAVEEEIKTISATKIRELIKERDDSWKELIASQGVAILLEKEIKKYE